MAGLRKYMYQNEANTRDDGYGSDMFLQVSLSNHLVFEYVLIRKLVFIVSRWVALAQGR